MKLQASALGLFVFLATVLNTCTGLYEVPYSPDSELGLWGFNDGYYPGPYPGGFPGYHNYPGAWMYPGRRPGWGYDPYRPPRRKCGRKYCRRGYRCFRPRVYCVRGPCPQVKPQCYPIWRRGFQ